MRYRLNRYTIPRMLRRHIVGFGFGALSAAVLAGAVQTAVQAARPGVSLAGELAWHIGVAVAILVGMAGLTASIIWLGVRRYWLAEVQRRRVADEPGPEEPLALWRVRRPSARRQWGRRQHRRHPHRSHRHPHRT
jgi:hypothetical protein